MQMNGAEIFVKALADLGVEVVFGYPGGATIHSERFRVELTPRLRAASDVKSSLRYALRLRVALGLRRVVLRGDRRYCDLVLDFLARSSLGRG